MNDSLRDYIDRLSTEKIETFIKQCSTGELGEDFSYIIPYLQYVLERRKETASNDR